MQAKTAALMVQTVNEGKAALREQPPPSFPSHSTPRSLFPHLCCYNNTANSSANDTHGKVWALQLHILLLRSAFPFPPAEAPKHSQVTTIRFTQV
jgi:hypothetical protein